MLYVIGATPAELTVYLYDASGDVQWYVSTTGADSGFEAIEGATGWHITPSTDNPGITYYYCKATVRDSDTGETKTEDSAVAVIEVTEPQTYTLTVVPGAHMRVQTDFTGLTYETATSTGPFSSTYWAYVNPDEGYTLPAPTVSPADGGGFEYYYNPNISVTGAIFCNGTPTANVTYTFGDAIPISSDTPATTELEVGEGKAIVSYASAATVTGSVTDGTATINVKCDKACVVAYTKDGGATWTRLPATANGNGQIDANDISLFVNACNGDYSSISYAAGLTILIGDADSDQALDANDLSSLVNASNGTPLSW